MYSKISNITFKTSTVNDIIMLLKENKKLTNSEKYCLLFLIAEHLDYKKFWKPVIVRYIKDLENIIMNVPPTKKPMVVYLSTLKSNISFIASKLGLGITKTNPSIISNNFISTSLSAESALKIGNSASLIRIILPPGTRCLLRMGLSLSALNFESLLGCTTKVYLSNKSKTASRITTEMCPSPSTNITVFDGVVTGNTKIEDVISKL
jgi:hypothetical protein